MYFIHLIYQLYHEGCTQYAAAAKTLTAVFYTVHDFLTSIHSGFAHERENILYFSFFSYFKAKELSYQMNMFSVL